MTINSRQFGMYERHDDYTSDKYNSMSEYFVGEPDPDTAARPGEFFQASGRVSVSHFAARPPRPSYVYGDNADANRFPGQQALFEDWGEQGAPAKSKVSLMTFTKATRARALPLLGRAALDARERYGTDLTPDTDRSDHSERLVQRLSERGAVKGNQRDIDNGMDFPDHPTTIFAHGVTPLTPERFEAGRKHARQVLRSTRPGRTAGEQATLF
jgi:hypothetical protein